MNAIRQHKTSIPTRPAISPARPGRSPNGDVGVTCLPEAHVRLHTLVQEAETLGGDLIDLRRSDDRAVGVTLADVTGHGMEAAPYAERVRDVLATLDESDRNAPAWLRALNDRLCARLDDDHLCAAISAKLRWSTVTETLAVSLAIAGMPTPVLYRASADRVEHVGAHALPLGVEPRQILLPEPATCTLGPGDLLVLVSDGVTEAGDVSSGLFGTTRVDHMVRSLAPAGGRAVLEGLAAAVRRRQHAGTTPDDFTIAVIALTDQATQATAA